MALYEKLRATNGGVGAAALQRRPLQGCRLELNPTEIGRIRAATGGRGAALRGVPPDPRPDGTAESRSLAPVGGGSSSRPTAARAATQVRPRTARWCATGPSGEVLVEIAETSAAASNNVAEYRGLIAGLEAVRELDPEAQVEVRLDSKLVVEQMSGRWKVKHPDMRTLAKRALGDHATGTGHLHLDPAGEEQGGRPAGQRGSGPAEAGRPWVERPRGVPGSRQDDDGTGPGLADELEDAPPTSWSAGRTTGGADDAAAAARRDRAHRAKRFSGSGGDDPALTEDGRAQAGAAARRWRNAAASTWS